MRYVPGAYWVPKYEKNFFRKHILDTDSIHSPESGRGQTNSVAEADSEVEQSA